jgi:L-rhamnose mutarotase
MGDDTALRTMLRETAARSDGRCCFLLHVRPEKLGEYVLAHQQVWDEMREALTEAGWRNYSLFLRPDDGLVVGYFEADDVVAAQDAMSRSQVGARWEAAMAQYFTPGGESKHELSQYFHLP